MERSAVALEHSVRIAATTQGIQSSIAGETTALISTHAQPIPTRSSCGTAGQPFAFP